MTVLNTGPKPVEIHMLLKKMCFNRKHGYIWTAEWCFFFFHHNNHVVLPAVTLTGLTLTRWKKRVQMQWWTRATFAFLQMCCFYGLTSSVMHASLSWSLACIAEVTRSDLWCFISVFSLWGVNRHIISLNPDVSVTCSKWFSLQIQSDFSWCHQTVFIIVSPWCFCFSCENVTLLKWSWF